MSDLPFEPLFAPRVEAKDAKPVPVSWYARVAPQLPPAPVPERSLNYREDLANGIYPVLFADVSSVASEEYKIKNKGNLETPEIARLREAARLEAQQTIDAAAVQAQAIRAEAKEAGYRDGYEKGYIAGERAATELVLQRGADERESLRLDIADFLQLVEAERLQVWAGIEPQAIDLIFALCKQVIKQEIEVSRTVAVEIIKNALRRVAESGAIRVRVHPDDLENVRSHRGEFMQLLDGNQNVEIVPDRRVSPGGSVVETESGSIDSRIETQLTQVGETLEQVLATVQES